MQPVIRTILTMTQRQMPFLTILQPPQFAGQRTVNDFATYRDAVIWCWQNRPYRGLREPDDQALCARQIGLHVPHMSRCVNPASKAPMSLNPDLLQAFENYTGWKAASQFVALRSNMTVLEQVIAERKAA